MFVQSSLNYVNAFNPSLFIVINGISLFFIFTGVYICCSKEKKIAAKDKEVADRKNKSNHPKSFECKSTSSKALKTATVSSATAKKTTVCDVGKQVSQNKTERKTAENTANQPCALETKDETTKASNPKFGKYVPSKSDASMSSNFDATKTERSDRPVKTTPSTKIFNFFSSLKSFGLSRKKSKITVTQPPPIDNSSSTSTDDKSRMIDKPGRPDDVPPSYTGGMLQQLF
uniref:Uncharacterized protein n=1 Tax=Romanomermis culicivorax TaxID=13658 RepID=A0A915JZA9_ROMCU